MWPFFVGINICIFVFCQIVIWFEKETIISGKHCGQETSWLLNFEQTRKQALCLNVPELFVGLNKPKVALISDYIQNICCNSLEIIQQLENI